VGASITVVISGSFREVNDKMLRVKDRLDSISRGGFRRYQADEEWQYHTADYDVCPECVPLDEASFRGDMLQYDFPNIKAYSTLEARVNNETPFHKANSCKCSAEWQNFEECIVTRVCEAILEA